jgi:hypothetical protein
VLSDIVSLSNIAVAVVAIVALYLTRIQLRVLGDQVVQANQAALSQAYSQISQATAEFNEMFLDHPEWYSYFYEGKEAGSGREDLTLRTQLEHVSETFMDFVDVVVELRNAAPFAAMDWSTWESWFRFVYNNSPALRAWVLDNVTFCPDYQLAPLGFIVVRDAISGQVTGRWHACEFDEDDASHISAAQRLWADNWKAHISAPGFPWVRTWVMQRIEDAEPSVIASVKVSRPDEAWVSVHWLPGRDVLAEEILYSWLLGILAGSKLIMRVVIKTHLMLQASEEVTYQIRDAKANKNSSAPPARHQLSQEPFLLPRFRPIQRRWSSPERPATYQPRRRQHDSRGRASHQDATHNSIL